MNEAEENRRLWEMRNCPLTLKVALYNIMIINELEVRGLPDPKADAFKERLKNVLDYSYYDLKGISLDLYNFLSESYL